MKYPNGIKKEYKSIQSHSNRGMNLENDLNDSNNYYLVNDIAVIYKKPTPIKILHLDFAPIRGPEGNIEYLMHIYKAEMVSDEYDAEAIVKAEYAELIDNIVANAHKTLDN